MAITGGIMAGIGALGSAGASIYGALNSDGTAAGVNVPPPWRMPDMTGAANSAYGGIQNLPGQQIPGQASPQIWQIAQQLANNPYAQMFQQGANNIAPVGQQVSQGAIQAGQQFQQAGQSAIPYASQIMGTAFDPQNALYGKLSQQITDQTRAGESARGIAMTPYGASLENDAMRKFNIDWQNQQLGRQTQGAGAAGNLLTSGLQTSAGGSALSGTGVQQYAQSSGIPYATYNTIGQGAQGALQSGVGGASQAQQLALNPVQAYLQYLGLGNQAGSVANQGTQLGLNQAQMAFNQQQTLGGQLGAGLSGIGNQSNWNWLSGLGGGGRTFSGDGSQSSMGGGYGGGAFG